MVGFIEEELAVSADRLRWEIQSPSSVTGRSTDLEGVCEMLFWPVEEVRGGMALGDRGESEIMVEGPACERFRWNIWERRRAPGCRY